jgi:hypothetical protein
MYSLLKSRTVWTFAFMFVVGGINALTNVLPPTLDTVLLGAAGLLGVYFKVNPSQTYNPVAPN